MNATWVSSALVYVSVNGFRARMRLHLVMMALYRRLCRAKMRHESSRLKTRRRRLTDELRVSHDYASNS